MVEAQVKGSSSNVESAGLDNAFSGGVAAMSDAMPT